MTSLDHQHQKAREGHKPASELHSLRHTYGTRPGEAGADAFTIVRLMGHPSVTVSLRYVHPTPRALESAVRRLEMLNPKFSKAAAMGGEGQLPATVSATSQQDPAVN